MYSSRMPVFEEEFLTGTVVVNDHTDSTEIIYGEALKKPEHFWVFVKPKSSLARVANDEDPFSPPLQK